jgi:hypothetical protein
MTESIIMPISKGMIRHMMRFMSAALPSRSTISIFPPDPSSGRVLAAAV